MKKIFIVEDNKDSREILSLFLTKLGHQVIKAINSSEAISYAEAECPDLILMDLDLPDADGIKTTAILKQNPKTSHIPVVAVTAWMSALSEKSFESGYCKLLDQTSLASDIKGDHQGIYHSAAHPRGDTILNHAFVS